MPNYNLGKLTDICKKGAAASKEVQQANAKARWEANRPYCRGCGKLFPWQEGKQCYYQMKRKYCNSRCRAKLYWKTMREKKRARFGPDGVILDWNLRLDEIARARVGVSARRHYEQQIGPRICERCGYKKLPADIAHVKAVKDFPKSALVREVNQLTNLIALCKRCHWEFDKGLVPLSAIQKLIAARDGVPSGDLTSSDS